MDSRYSAVDEEESTVGAYKLRPCHDVAIYLEFDQVHLTVKLKYTCLVPPLGVGQDLDVEVVTEFVVCQARHHGIVPFIGFFSDF